MSVTDWPAWHVSMAVIGQVHICQWLIGRLHMCPWLWLVVRVNWWIMCLLLWLVGDVWMAVIARVHVSMAMIGRLDVCPWLWLVVQVHIEFTDEQDVIRVEGPPDDVEQATKLLQDVVNDLVSNYCLFLRLSHRPSTSTKLYCLVTEAHRCEQLAQGCYAALSRRELNPWPTDRKSNALPLLHDIYTKVKKASEDSERWSY